jgi:hypothetical protein
VKAFLGCETGGSTPEKAELGALATDLLLLVVQQEKLCDIAKGGRSGDQWKKLNDAIFAEGGLFGGYKMWACNSAWNTKLKPLCQSIIKHFSDKHNEKGGANTTALEDVAKTLSLRMAAAERGKEDDKDRTYAKKVQNELVEADMGFRPNGNGVASPSGVAVEASYQEGLALLGVQTGSVDEAAGKSLHSNCYAITRFTDILFYIKPSQIQPQQQPDPWQGRYSMLLAVEPPLRAAWPILQARVLPDNSCLSKKLCSWINTL